VETLKAAGYVIGGMAIFAGLAFLSAVFILGAETVSEKALPFSDIATVLALVVCVAILLPLSAFRATRIVSVWGFLIASFVFGLDIWMYSFIITFSLWGPGGVIIGLCLVGIGIVPLALIAATTHLLWPTVGNIVFGISATYGARIFSFYLADTLDRAQQLTPDAQAIDDILRANEAKNKSKRREGLLTIRGYVSIAHIIVLIVCWYLLSFLVKDNNDEGGIFGIVWLGGYFFLAEFIFTNNWLVASVERRMGYIDSQGEKNDDRQYNISGAAAVQPARQRDGVDDYNSDLGGKSNEADHSLAREENVSIGRASYTVPDLPSSRDHEQLDQDDVARLGADSTTIDRNSGGVTSSGSPLKRLRGVAYTMNGAQKTIVSAIALVLTIMLLFPPFHSVGMHGSVSGRGFSFILSPPGNTNTVDTMLLLIEIAVCLIVGGLLYLIVNKTE
jgi:hypothetical protein